MNTSRCTTRIHGNILQIPASQLEYYVVNVWIMITISSVHEPDRLLKRIGNMRSD